MMKKWMVLLMIGLVSAVTALAQEPAPACSNACADDALAPPPGGPQSWDRGQSKLTPEQREKMREHREEMKAQHEEVLKLVAQINAEADPVKKEALTVQLRTKVSEGFDRMVEAQKKMIEKAEAQAAKLQAGLEKRKAKLDESIQNKDQKVDEHLKALLAGEKPPHAGRMGAGKFGRRPQGGSPAEEEGLPPVE